MFEVYLVGAIGVMLSEFEKLKCYFASVLSLQSIIVLLIGLYSVYSLASGIFTDHLRKNVMAINADGYEIAQLFDNILPENAVLLTDVRSKVLIPRNVIFADNYQYARTASDVERLISMENKNNKITHAAFGSPLSQNYKSLEFCTKPELMNIYEVRKATRNPFNQSKKKLVVFKIDAQQEGCFLGKGR